MKETVLRKTWYITIFISLILAIRPNTGSAEQPEGTETELEVSGVENFTETLEEPTEPAIEYRYIEGCPLDAEIQRGIFDICERYNVAFELVMAVIMQESSYRADCVGDNGNSIGLMQIQPKWHSELMAELGVTNLYDPLQNVEVGVAIMAMHFERYGEAYDALMAYNGGASYANRMIEAGKVSDYALEVVELAREYTEQNE